VMTLSLLGVSLPTFLIGILLILVFAVLLQWLPSFGRGDTVALGAWTTGLLTVDGWKHLVLPAITLSVFQLALILRLVRSEMLEVLRTDYVKFARARGLQDRREVVQGGGAVRVPGREGSVEDLERFAAVRLGFVWPAPVHQDHPEAAEIEGDAVQPGREARRGRVAPARAQHAQEDLLHEVLAAGDAAEEARQERVDLARVVLDDAVEGLLLAGLVGEHPGHARVGRLRLRGGAAGLAGALGGRTGRGVGHGRRRNRRAGGRFRPKLDSGGVPRSSLARPIHERTLH